MTTVTVTPRVKKQLTNIMVGDKLIINADGVLLVTTTPKTKEQIIKERYGHLINNRITMTDAAKKYNVPRGTLEKWYHRCRYISPIDVSYPAVFDEAEISYLADIYHERRKTGSKAPLVDKNGLPYQLKRPDVSEYRRNKKV